MALKIGIIIGSTRPGRLGTQVADWVKNEAAKRDGVEYELVDIADYNLPLLDESLPAAYGQYEHEHTKKWAAKIAEFDGYIFVTPEYNHSTSGALKNAIDFVGAEWNNKALGLVGYGSLGASRAIEHLRGIAAEIQLADVRQTVHFSLFTDFEEFTTFIGNDRAAGEAETMFGQVEAWAGALKSLRA
ncbi:NADPH-dependent oxidoreductase [Gulosibacter macacae]|uniref:NADPH-dependent oxidoreductase n=1 Tax=Gulosibacter macacae TaxID=2488791 RepID=A0A3P3W0M2_9MICO|nr:NAD(P)H-dependent oxidoreductase [Gulosibacter macacae]RRJ86433.1 NADPH-dependent oxidoreductase [Gulosibacter macacae]